MREWAGASTEAGVCTADRVGQCQAMVCLSVGEGLWHCCSLIPCGLVAATDAAVAGPPLYRTVQHDSMTVQHVCVCVCEALALSGGLQQRSLCRQLVLSWLVAAYREGLRPLEGGVAACCGLAGCEAVQITAAC